MTIIEAGDRRRLHRHGPGRHGAEVIKIERFTGDGARNAKVAPLPSHDRKTKLRIEISPEEAAPVAPLRVAKIGPSILLD